MKTSLLQTSVAITILSGCALQPNKTLKIPAAIAPRNSPSMAETEKPREILPTQVFCVSTPFTIIIEDPKILRERIQRETGLTNGVALFNRETRTMYVPYANPGSEDEFDVRGKRMPAIPSLGHELWHLPELGGWWHVQPPARLQNEKRQKMLIWKTVPR